MAQKLIITGSTPNDKTGDSLRNAFNKVNDNFTELFNADATPAYHLGDDIQFVDVDAESGMVVIQSGFDTGMPVYIKGANCSDGGVGGNVIIEAGGAPLPNTGTTGNVEIAAQQTTIDSNNNVWTFGEDGDLTLPGALYVTTGLDGAIIGTNGVVIKAKHANPLSLEWSLDGEPNIYSDNPALNTDIAALSFGLAGVVIEVNNPTGGGYWTFGPDGKLRLPTGGDIVDSNGDTVLGGTSGSGDRLVNGSLEVVLDEIGTLTVPGSIALQDGIITGNGNTNPGIVLGSSDKSVFVRTLNGVNSSTWEFDTNGYLNLPGGTSFIVAEENSVAIQPNGAPGSSGLELNNLEARLISQEVITLVTGGGAGGNWTFDTKGTLTVPHFFPRTFTATLDRDHITSGYIPLGGDEDWWHFEVTFNATSSGTIETVITNDTPWANHPNYQDGYAFSYTEADHGVPGYTFTLTLVDIQHPGEMMWTTNLQASPAPAYPATIKNGESIKLTADAASFTLGADGSLHFPDGSFQGTAFVGLATSAQDLYKDGNITIGIGDGILTTQQWTFSDDGSLSAPGTISAKTTLALETTDIDTLYGVYQDAIAQLDAGFAADEYTGQGYPADITSYEKLGRAKALNPLIPDIWITLAYNIRTAYFQWAAASVTLTVDESGFYITNGGGTAWRFDEATGLRFPDNTYQTTAFTGTASSATSASSLVSPNANYNLTANNYGLETNSPIKWMEDATERVILNYAPADDRFVIATGQGGTPRYWYFGDNGNLTLPAGGDILDSTGTSVLGGNTGNLSFNGNNIVVDTQQTTTHTYNLSGIGPRWYVDGMSGKKYFLLNSSASSVYQNFVAGMTITAWDNSGGMKGTQRTFTLSTDMVFSISVMAGSYVAETVETPAGMGDLYAAELNTSISSGSLANYTFNDQGEFTTNTITATSIDTAELLINGEAPPLLTVNQDGSRSIVIDTRQSSSELIISGAGESFVATSGVFSYYTMGPSASIDTNKFVTGVRVLLADAMAGQTVEFDLTSNLTSIGGNTWTANYTQVSGDFSSPRTRSRVTITTTTGGLADYNFSDAGEITLPAGGDIVDSTGNSVLVGREAPFEIKGTNFTAVAGHRYGVNTLGAPVTAYLPLNPAVGDAILFVDSHGGFSTNNFTIDGGDGFPAAKNIMGQVTQVLMVDNDNVGIFYNGTEWRFYA